jgi:Carbohydrate family 9 binding domain-like
MNDEATVIARYVSGSPSIYDVGSWDQASPVLIQHLWTGAPAPPERHAEVRLCWSGNGLHTRFLCQQHEPLVIANEPVTEKKTLGLWDRDVCEVFIAPDAANPSIYYEFEAAPTGEWVDLAITMTPTGRNTEWDYSSGMTTTSSVVHDNVVIGITIPWSTRIPRTTTGDLWRLNLFRCVGSHPRDRYLAWRPTGTPEPNFHVPDAFGWLRFE